jgi:hypothetical protein
LSEPGTSKSGSVNVILTKWVWAASPGVGTQSKVTGKVLAGMTQVDTPHWHTEPADSPSHCASLVQIVVP